MKLILPVLLALFLSSTLSGVSCAAPLKTHVAEFTVAGAPHSGELKLTLQSILTSRLNPELVQLVEKPDQAEILITGSYALFGSMFSLDARIKNDRNGSLVKVFEQGKTQEDVIPALGRLAQKIDAELLKNQIPADPKQLTPAAPPTGLPPDTKDTYVLRPEPSAKNSPNSWSSVPLTGVFISIAAGQTRSSGERELFVATENAVRAYLKGNNLQLLAEIVVPAPAKILALDTADLDRDGTPELYVSISHSGMPASRVYQLDGTAFKSVAGNLPWFFRGIGCDPASRTVYAQELQSDGKFYGAVKELSKSEARFTALNPLNLPRSGNIFNFNRLRDASGKSHYVVLNEDRYLVVYSPEGSEEWRSSDKFGGSESFYNSETPKHVRSSRDSISRKFLEQRISLMKDGTLLVPANESSLSFGTIRNFNKYALYAFEWTGAQLREKWHTRQSSGYLADYAFDQTTGEVLLMEVVRKTELFNEGTSVITIKRLD